MSLLAGQTIGRKVNPHFVAGFVIAASVTLSVITSLGVPLFEGPDEAQHYLYIRYLVNEQRFPTMQIGGPIFSAYHHPPLYYLIGAAATFWTPDHGLTGLLAATNPFAGYRAGAVGHDNKNSLLHSSAEAFPFRSLAAGPHLIRLFSVLLGAGTLLIGYQLARRIWRADNWLPATALAVMALVPNFAAQNGMITNDSLTVFWAHLLIYLCVISLDHTRGSRLSLFMGAVWGFALLTKVSALALVVPMTIAAALSMTHVSEAGRALRRLGLAGLLAIVISGGWFVRNIWLYHDLTGFGQMLKVMGETAPFSLSQAVSLIPWTFTTFWARFGSGRIESPAWVYAVFGILLTLAAAGWIAAGSNLTNRWDNLAGRGRACLLLAANVVTFAIAVMASASVSHTGAQGRYLYPVIGPLAILMVAGWSALISPRHYQTLALAVTSLMSILATGLIVTVVLRAYARPPLYQASNFENNKIAYPLDKYFGDIRLRGYSLTPDTVHPGDDLLITLYWEPLKPTAANYPEFVQVITPGGNRVGSRDTHPGLGNYPTSLWMPGTVIVDTIPVPISADAPVPAKYDLLAGFNDPETGQRLAMTDASGQPVASNSIGWVRVLARRPTLLTAGVPVQAEFAATIELEACQLTPGNINLQWVSHGRLDADYTIFTHYFDRAGQLVGQADHVPNAGLFPTSVWRAGDQFVETIPVPPHSPGQIGSVRVGFYSLVTGERLEATVFSGTEVPENALDLPAECIP